MSDIQDLFEETIAGFMEKGMEAVMEEEPGYGKYAYRDKETDNSWNGHSSKALKTFFGDAEAAISLDRKGEFEPHLLKKNQNSIGQDASAAFRVFAR